MSNCEAHYVAYVRRDRRPLLRGSIPVEKNVKVRDGSSSSRRRPLGCFDSARWSAMMRSFTARSSFERPLRGGDGARNWLCASILSPKTTGQDCTPAIMTICRRMEDSSYNAHSCARIRAMLLDDISLLYNASSIVAKLLFSTLLTSKVSRKSCWHRMPE